jgi:ribosomal protein L16 Arg81 hydroxylase
LHPFSILKTQFSRFTTSTKEPLVEFTTTLKSKFKQQLQKYLQQYEEIQRKLSEEAATLSPKEFIKLSKEAATLSPLVDTYKDYEAKFNVLKINNTKFPFKKNVFNLLYPNVSL